MVYMVCKNVYLLWKTDARGVFLNILNILAELRLLIKWKVGENVPTLFNVFNALWLMVLLQVTLYKSHNDQLFAGGLWIRHQPINFRIQIFWAFLKCKSTFKNVLERHFLITWDLFPHWKLKNGCSLSRLSWMTESRIVRICKLKTWNVRTLSEDVFLSISIVRPQYYCIKYFFWELLSIRHVFVFKVGITFSITGDPI